MKDLKLSFETATDVLSELLYIHFMHIANIFVYGSTSVNCFKPLLDKARIFADFYKKVNYGDVFQEFLVNNDKPQLVIYHYHEDGSIVIGMGFKKKDKPEVDRYITITGKKITAFAEEAFAKFIKEEMPKCGASGEKLKGFLLTYEECLIMNNPNKKSSYYISFEDTKEALIEEKTK